MLTVLRKTCFQPLLPERTETSGFAPAKPLAARDCPVFKSQQTPPRDAKGRPFPTTRNQVYPQGYRGFESHPLRQLRNSPYRCASRPEGAESSAGRGIPSPSPANRFAGFAGDFFCGGRRTRDEGRRTGDEGRGTGGGCRFASLAAVVVGFVENSLCNIGVLWNLAEDA